jgi:NADH:ubiquinone oxidoreductase subunit 3 (subunit A)
MTEESINIFISNIYSIAIFAGVFLFVFVFLFLLSRFLIYKSKKKEQTGITDGNLIYLRKKLKSSIIESEPVKSKSFACSLYDLKKDSNILKNLFVIGLLFISTIFFILLIILSLYFATNFQQGGSFYLILSIVFLILVITVYAVRSKIIDK